MRTSSSLDVKSATSSTDGGAGLAEGGAMVGGALPGGAPGGGRRLPGSPGGEALDFAGVVEGDAVGEPWGSEKLDALTLVFLYGRVVWRFPCN